MSEAKTRRSVLFAALGSAIALGTPAIAQETAPANLQTPSPAPPQPSTQKTVPVTDRLDKALKPPKEKATARLGALRSDVPKLSIDESGHGNAPATTLYQRDPAQWQKLKDLANDYVQFAVHSTDGKTPVPAHIEANFRFMREESDNAFRPQYADLLLDQSADLLERALSQRAEWNDLLTKAFNVGIELRQFLELDAIHVEEAAKGFYTHDSAEAQNLWRAEQMNSGGVENQASFLAEINNQYFSSSKINEQSGSSQLLAWLSHLANYTKETQDTEFMTYTWNDVTRQSNAFAADAAANLSFNNLFLQNAMLSSQQLALGNSGAVSDCKAEAYATRSAWEAANSGFRQRRTEVSRRLADIKSLAYTHPGGALNYPERMKLLRMRFERDLRDALARVHVAADGLALLYGYRKPLPTAVTNAVTKGKGIPAGAYDECLVWVREAIAYLVRFNQVEQKYSLPLSIRTQLGDGAFKAGAGSAAPSWTFDFPKELFHEQYFVRLRGVSVYVVPKPSILPTSDITHVRGVWKAFIKAPSKGLCAHLSQSDMPATIKTIDQSHIAPAIAGRVSYRENRRAADVIGSSSFYNVSPLGDGGNLWTVRIDPKSTEGVPTSELQDVVLELHLAMRFI